MGLPSRLFVLLLVGNQWVNARSFQRPVFTKWLFVAQERPAAVRSVIRSHPVGQRSRSKRQGTCRLVLRSITEPSNSPER